MLVQCLVKQIGSCSVKFRDATISIIIINPASGHCCVVVESVLLHGEWCCVLACLAPRARTMQPPWVTVLDFESCLFCPCSCIRAYTSLCQGVPACTSSINGHCLQHMLAAAAMVLADCCDFDGAYGRLGGRWSQ